MIISLAHKEVEIVTTKADYPNKPNDQFNTTLRSQSTTDIRYDQQPVCDTIYPEQHAPVDSVMTPPLMDTQQESHSTPNSYWFDYDTNMGEDPSYPFEMTPPFMDTQQECHSTPNPYGFDYDTNMGDDPNYQIEMTPPLVDTEQMIYSHELKLQFLKVQIFCINNQIVFKL